VGSLTQRLPIEFSILLPTLNIFKLPKIKPVHLILQALVEFMKRCDIRSRIEIHKDKPLARGISRDFEEAIDGFVEVRDAFEARGFD
jgi:hypothetical protein